jgi:hypothetical protein
MAVITLCLLFKYSAYFLEESQFEGHCLLPHMLVSYLLESALGKWQTAHRTWQLGGLVSREEA